MVGRFFREYVFKLVVTVAITSTVAIAALANRLWTWPNAVVGSVLLACGVVFLMDRLGVGPSLKSRVRDWLDGSSFDVKTIQDTNEIHYVVTDNIGMKTDIIQVKHGGPIEIISIKHTATPDQLAVYNKMNEPEKATFWRDIRLELLRYGLAFTDLRLDGDGVAFSDTLVAGSHVSSIDFLKRLLFVRSGARLYWELSNNLTHSTTSAAGAAAGPQSSKLDAKLPPPSQA